MRVLLNIASDISLAALKLNRQRNPHKNSLYVLCTADRLPIRSGAIDILCYFGILHHTERKCGTIPHDVELVKEGGYVILFEGLARPFVTKLLKLPSDEESAHEERLDRKELLNTIHDLPYLRVLAIREFHTAFYGFAFRILRKSIVTHKTVFRIISVIDALLMRALRRIAPIFNPGAILILLQRTQTETKRYNAKANALQRIEKLSS